MASEELIPEEVPLPRRPRGGRNRIKPEVKEVEQEAPAYRPKPKIVSKPAAVIEEKHVPVAEQERPANDPIPATETSTSMPLQYSLGKRKRQSTIDQTKQVHYVHPFFAQPISISSDLSANNENSLDSLASDVQTRLKEMGYLHLFPVQSAVIPILSSSSFPTSASRQRDVLVSAPTGSGKTLSYVIPIVQALKARSLVRIRALVVLPTRDLAAQVRQVFVAFAKGTDLKIGFAAGGVSLTTEQGQLVQHDDLDLEEGGSSRVDILIATPGRLVDHLRLTSGFTLRHLRYLVIDEADKLLGTGYQGWVAAVLKSAQPDTDVEQSGNVVNSWTGLAGWPEDEIGLPLHKTRVVRHTVLPNNAPLPHHAVPLQKLLFSATLTQNPAKLASLKLHYPIYISVQPKPKSNSATSGRNIVAGDDMDTATDHEPVQPVTEETKRYTVPSTLTEHLMVVPDEFTKPLALIHLLYTLRLPAALVFCKSIDATHRLATLLNIFAKQRQTSSPSSPPIHATMLTSDLARRDRKKILDKFTAEAIQVLVCSDLLTRGTDLGPAIKTVISYDIPANTKTYVHRVGRTARAGADGVAYVLSAPKEAHHVKAILAEVGRDSKFRRDKWDAEFGNVLMDDYKAALVGLGKAVKGAVEEDVVAKAKTEVMEADGSAEAHDNGDDDAEDEEQRVAAEEQDDVDDEEGKADAMEYEMETPESKAPSSAKEVDKITSSLWSKVGVQVEALLSHIQ
ncbi:hypothetical protein SmJEL517_g01278 [Synchytrium microbalum]|uniref:ATP-dependent RNA helicase n=1 Tax=Synchytrium microbalum TaxID=1806994 RepID=A0A507C6B9_9FUNG|nr:uncharacterized protein SmJEL517_g01278 [Synchytrium microbalum]TPX36577.1 hypothetical protein SmJEL517_g01278 [Synchytrium microbalum]